MNGSNPFVPADPFELAAPRALQATGADFSMSLQDEMLVAELDHGAAELGFHDESYFVESNLGFVIPISFDAEEPLTFVKLGGVTFEGKFATYAKVHIGKLIGGTTVRALCLTFKEAMLLPFLDTVEEDSLLHVPVLAIDSISQTS